MRGLDPITTLEVLTLAALWCAGIYRLVITLGQQWALWRASFTTAMLLLPLATTAHFFRSEFSSLLGAPNSGGLIARICFVAAAASVAIYVDTLTQETPRPRRVVQHLATGGVTILTIVVTWLIAPIHGRELTGLSPYSTHPAVAAHNLTFYSYLGIVLVVVVAFCVRETRASWRTALPKTASLTLIGLGCGLGLPVLATFAAATAVTALAGRELVDMQRLVLLAAVAAPWSLGLLAAGVLSLLVLPGLTDYYAALRRWRQLRPLWEDLVKRHPQVRLRTAGWHISLRALQVREQRAIIEMHDALQRTVVSSIRGEGVQGLAHSLVSIDPADSAPAGGCLASEVLTPAHNHQGDLDQMLALAQALTNTRRNIQFTAQRVRR